MKLSFAVCRPRHAIGRIDTVRFHMCAPRDNVGQRQPRSPPMILYKYLHPDRVDVLEQKMVRFTQPGDFNDPFEFRPYIESAASDEAVRDYVEANFDKIVDAELAKYDALLQPGIGRALREMARLNKSSVLEFFRHLEPQGLKSFAPSIDAVLNKNVGILCLSELPDSILMWGHYTDAHRGFVIGFDSDHAFFSKRRGQQDEFGFLRPVIYQRERPRIVLSDTSSPAWFNTKSDQWVYEKEWRILRVLSEADRTNERAGFPVCLFGFPEDSVLEIIIGLRSSSSLTQQLQSLARAFPRAVMRQAREDARDYSLVFTEI
jgi:Protein of unknown function (DUF2971)